MDDTISKQMAIDALAKAMPSLTTPDGCGQFDHDIYIAQETFVDSMQIIADLPSAERWIPVTERMPEEDGRYLITGKRGTVYSLEYEDERWYGGIQPIAWMPLPEPYKGGE